MKKYIFLFLLSVLLTTSAMADVQKFKKQTVYVPAYSHIYVGTKVSPFELAITLSIRNTSSTMPITISAADYYDSNGKLIKQYIDKPITIKPFATISYKVAEHDKTGGSGANFLVKWNSEDYIHPPVVESVMIGTRSSQGISFTSRGVVIED